MSEFSVDFSSVQPNYVRPELLTHPNIPSFMAGVNPRTILGREWWDKVRRAAYAANNYFCWACGEKPDGPLHGHEAYSFDYENCIMTFVEVTALCSDCHAFIHSGRLAMDLRAGKCSKDDVKRIICGRVNILKCIGLKPSWFTRALYLVTCEGWDTRSAWIEHRPRANDPDASERSTKWRLIIGEAMYDRHSKLI